MVLILLSKYLKLIGLNMTCHETRSQVQCEQKARHLKYTIVARGYLKDQRNHNINS